MKNKARCLLRTVIAASVIAAQCLPALGAVQADDLCSPVGYTVGFFNGVLNTSDQAHDGMSALQSVVGTEFNDESVQYENFYNHSGGVMQDLAETFVQRAAEIDRSGELGARWEFFWDSLSGDQGLVASLTTRLPAAASLMDAIHTSLSTRIVAFTASLFTSQAPTQADYASHNTRLDALLVQKQKLMLVAHSQGNLFMNQAYDYIEPKAGRSVAAVHVAPASPTLRGPHVLADIDLVINAMRAQGLASVPPANISLPYSRFDVTGHFFAETYLDAARSARSLVASLVETAMDSLQTPETDGSPGAFTVTLTWDGPGDVDLHTFEPTGTHVYYDHPVGHAGFLDVDNTVGYGPEHYYAACDSRTLQTGAYAIVIDNFDKTAGRQAKVQVASSREGVIFTAKLPVGTASTPVMSVLVSQDQKGRFRFAAQ